MFYELFRSKMERTFPNTLGGAGPIMKYRAKADEAEIDDYLSKLEGGEHVSGKERAYAPQSIMDKFFEMSKHERYSTRILGRAYDGFYSACHVFAYLGGRERSFGENWDTQNRICANMICTSILHISPIYKGNDVKDIELEFSDFDIDGPSYRPIVLNDTIVEAFKRFPVDLSFLNNKSEEKNDTSDEKPEEIEDKTSQTEESVVIDLVYTEVNEESKHDTSDKKEKKPEDKQPDVKPGNDDHNASKDQEKKPEEKKSEEKKSESAIFNYDNMRFIVNEDGTTNSVNNRAPANQEKKFKDLFGKYLEGIDYQVNKFPSGALECVIHKDNTFISHVIDPGLSVGDGYYVIAMINTGNPAQPFDTIPVHYSEEEILRKVFTTTDRKYVLTPDEYQKVLTHLFKNQRIYNVVDMSPLGGSIGENTKIGRIKKKPEDFRKLGQKLTFIINCIDNTPMLGRMRFSKFTSIDSFELRSDDKGGNIRSPFPPATLETKSGVVVQVEGDDVNIFFNGNSQKYHIDNYGIL